MPVFKKPRRKILCDKDDKEFDETAMFLFVQAANIQYKNQMKQLEILKKNQIMMIQKFVEYGKVSLPAHILNMPLGELRTMVSETSYPTGNSGFAMHKRSSSLSSTSNASFLNLGVSASTRRRSLSYDSDLKHKNRNLIYMTPGISRPPDWAITPKVNPDSPIGMLRVPHQGEFAVSVAGSPLLVSSFASSEKVNINIPLRNGKIVSILPKPTVNTDTIADNLDPTIKTQLKTLTHTLNSILRSCADFDNTSV